MQVYATLVIHLLSSASLGATTDGPAAREPLWLDTSAGTSTQCASNPNILACQAAPQPEEIWILQTSQISSSSTSATATKRQHAGAPLCGLGGCATKQSYNPLLFAMQVQEAVSVGIPASFKSLVVVPSNQTAIQKAAAMYQACMNFASSYLPETIELVRWMIDMNLDFQNTTRLETVDPVEMMVRGSLELGVEAIISIRFDERNFAGFRRLVTINYSKEQETWLLHRSYKSTYANEEHYGMLFLMAGVRRGEDLVFARKTLRYERQLRWIERNTVDWNKGSGMSIWKLGQHTTPYVTAEQWGNYFSKYTEGYYEGDAIIYNYVHGTMMIKKLFEDDVIGAAGLQYLVAWSIYRQLAEFTEPYLFRGDRTAEESCFVHVKNVMRLAVLSNYFNTEK
ncbi:uncharacterized protein LOC142802916 [Rhipicephalus microplus]|uniref:uncharacterized protein LOC142802916 n=1 Tax=Rhipicephalus microplus TaxID=6941 RepID=UPI003F6B1E1E